MSQQAHTQVESELLPIGAILSGSHWLDRVRVVRVEPRGAARELVEAVTLDEQSHLLSCLFKREDLDTLEVEVETDRPTLQFEFMAREVR